MVSLSKVFSWGANSHGQLGLGFASEMVTSPMVVPLPFTEEIALLSAGGGHILIYTENRRLFGCGWNNKGQLGKGEGDQQDCNTFQEIPLDLLADEQVQQLSCGWDTSAILTNARLFVFGGNSFHQLGFGIDSKENIRRPVQLTLPCNQTPLQVDLSVRQMVIRSCNTIYLCGKSKAIDEIEKESGKGERGDFMAYQPPDGVEMISAGQHHIIYTPGDKQIIGIGQNKFNQSGKVKFSQQIVQIRSGWTHNACLLTSGEVYLWGRNIYGQLGAGRISQCEEDPVKLNIPEKVKEIHLGSEHGLVQSITGNIYTWGWNEHGNCGNGSEENVLEPVKINLFDQFAVKSCSGSGFCFVVTRSEENNK